MNLSIPAVATQGDFMDIQIIPQRKDDNTMIVSFKGSLDTETYIECEKQLKTAINPAFKAYIFDMSELEYISSIGFAVLFRAKKSIEESGGAVVIANLKPNVKRIFESVKVLSESLFATLEQADEYLDGYIKFIDKKAKEEEE